MNNYFKVIAVVIFSVLPPIGMAQAVSATFMSIDFSGVNEVNTSDNAPAFTNEDIMTLNTGTEGLVSSVEVHNAYPRKSSTMIEGLWFECPEPDDTGYITFNLNPEKYVKTIRVNFYGCECSKEVGNSNANTEVNLMLNGKSNIKEFTNTQNKAQAISCTTDGEIIKTITFAVAYNDRYNTNNACLQYIRIYYDEVAPEDRGDVEEWSFVSSVGEVILGKEFEMPAFNAVPEIAADFISLSSSDPEVADIVDNKINIIGEGKTIITASLGENMLFKPNAAKPSSFELTVHPKSFETGVTEIESENGKSAIISLYDLQGRIVKGRTASGIYISEDKNGKKSKIIIQ